MGEVFTFHGIYEEHIRIKKIVGGVDWRFLRLYHSGITGLITAGYNGSKGVIVILDNCFDLR
jgi:TPP-dependent indolepyruvate ferredoxin oxidoreductase alpha subunit